MKKQKSQGKELFFTADEEFVNESLEHNFKEILEYSLIKDKTTVTPRDSYHALALAIRNRLVRKWLRTMHEYQKKDVKKLAYLSMEFLMGRLLGNTLVNLDYYTECSDVIADLGYNLEDLRELEPDMGLGNGGLGRLAACFLDSLATMSLPAFGYGIRYEYGIFHQDIKDGYQIELPDNWLKYGCPWEIRRPEIEYTIRFGGEIITSQTADGRMKFDWINTDDVLAMAYDVPIPGYKNNTVNNLRLWQARSTNEFNFKFFNSGDYLAAVEDKDRSENISRVLYPNDNVYSGKVLRLKQQYFFVSATLQDIIKDFKKNHDDFMLFPEKVAVQLNDTHPSIAIPELMRILMDEEHLEWNKAWGITKKVFAYTNHTVLPEALEQWDVNILGPLLPRQLQIIYEINRRFINEVRDFKGFDINKIREVSIVREGTPKMIRMANLAVIGSHAVNGVSRLHTEILKETIFKDFHNLDPHKISNKTNGITQRRWLKKANPLLSRTISDYVGDGWITQLEQLGNLKDHINDPHLRETWRQSKWYAKENLVRYIKANYGLQLNSDSLFDVQVKRMHEYKRQLLNILHVITMYNRLRIDPTSIAIPRSVIFAGKAAPGYFTSKLIIKLINAIAEVVNNDPDIDDKLKVIFMKNYSVSQAEKIIPAADLSEQISTAGYEASGTGNMKFMLNGALTIGTLDGANVEMVDAVGHDHMFIFGLTTEEVRERRFAGYNPQEYYEKDQELRTVLNMLQNNFFNADEPGIFQPLFNDLVMYGDNYMLLADYRAYIDAQEAVTAKYTDSELWTTSSIMNTAASGIFSSDRTIAEYSKEIWNLSSVAVPKENK
ncbi:glycogen/starch/alpha-glucan phosphorylase [bacterium]|nr:glycogen/starch/alpha-glucan phosphorylase [bacterium]